jgi:ferredoxin/flavodoxin---NADP+ reductase
LLNETITWVHHWSDRTFSFRTTRSSSFRFVAGEFATIGLEGTPMRAYSIVSPPWADYLEFLSIKVADGALTSKLQHVKEGDTLLIRPKVTGTLRNDLLEDGGKLVLLATGTGLAPFMSLLQDIETLERWSQIELYHNVRYREDLAYFDMLSTEMSTSEVGDLAAGKVFYHPLVTSEGAPRITTMLTNGNILTSENDRIMICGNLPFNKECAIVLKNKGMVEGSFRAPGQFVTEQAFVER